MIKKAFVNQNSHVICVCVFSCKRDQANEIIQQLCQVTGDTDTDKDDFEKINNKYCINFFLTGDPQNYNYDLIKNSIYQLGYELVNSQEELR